MSKEEEGVSGNRAERRAESARTRKFLDSIGVAPRIDQRTGEPVVDVEEIIRALGLEGTMAEQARASANALGAKVTTTEPMQ